MLTFEKNKIGRLSPFALSLLALLFTTLSCEKKRTPNAYELPENFSGWVTVKYEKPDAPPLKKINGYYLTYINDSGFAETSSRVQDGWAEDEYYWYDGNKKVILPQSSESNTTMIHAHTFATADAGNFMNADTLPVGVEVVLYDGSRYTKLDDKGGMSYKSGRFLLEHFYVSKKMEGYWDFNPPSMPESHNRW